MEVPFKLLEIVACIVHTELYPVLLPSNQKVVANMNYYLPLFGI